VIYDDLDSWDGQLRKFFNPLQGQEMFLVQNIQIGSGAHLASYSIGIKDSFFRGKAVRL
jgi:hypothetical protein